MRKTKSLSIIMAVVMLFAIASPTIFAEDTALSTPTEIAQETTLDSTDETPLIEDEESELAESTSTTDDMINAIISTNPEDASQPMFTQPIVGEASNEKSFLYNSNVIFSGVFSTHTMYFEVQDYWESQYAYACIQFSLSQLIEGENMPASLTFSVNNIPVASYKVDYANGKEQTMYVEIPTSLLTDGFNSFEVTGYVRIYDEEGCIDDMSGANWVNLKETSFINVGYNMIDSQQLIKWFPYPYISTANESGSDTAIAVSSKTLSSELEAALMLRSTLNSKTSQENKITLCTTSNIPKEKNIIIISNYNNLPAEYKAEIDALNTPVNDNGTIHAYKNSSGNSIMIITSTSDDGLYEAVCMLMDSSRVSQEKATTAIVNKNSSEPIRQSLAYKTTASDEYTLASLVNGGLYFVGPFHQEEVVYMPLTGGYAFAQSGKVSLNFRYSENLDFDRSLITVYWGNVPIASKKLTKLNAGGDTLTFTLPQDISGTSAASLTIAFDLELPDLFCTPRMDQMPWAYVTSDSTLYLPVGTQGEVSFDNNPYPFELSSYFNNLMVIIPDEISAEELNTIGQVVSFYSKDLNPYGEIKVVKASEFSESDSDYNIIAIGNYNNNSVIKALNSSLSFKYNENGTAFLSNEQLILSDEYAKNIACMQLINSPYSNDKSILVVSGTSDKTINYVNEYLQVEKNTWKLSKDAVIIDEDFDIKAYQFLQSRASLNAPNISDFIENNQDTVVFTVVAVSIMMILLLIVILFFIRMYSAKRKNSD